MSRYIDADNLHNAKFQDISGYGENVAYRVGWNDAIDAICENEPSIDIVRCAECKHRPIKEDADGENYGFNLIEPTEGDERCPCLVSDGWYSWMPQDDFYCGFGEREGE